MVQTMKETTNIWEYKFTIDAHIVNVVCAWKCRMIKGLTKALYPQENVT